LNLFKWLIHKKTAVIYLCQAIRVKTLPLYRRNKYVTRTNALQLVHNQYAHVIRDITRTNAHQRDVREPMAHGLTWDPSQPVHHLYAYVHGLVRVTYTHSCAWRPRRSVTRTHCHAYVRCAHQVWRAQHIRQDLCWHHFCI